MDMLRQIQADLLNDEVRLPSILRKARVLAEQLDSEELSRWVRQELDGYSPDSALPDYRVINTTVRGLWANAAGGIKTARLLHRPLGIPRSGRDCAGCR